MISVAKLRDRIEAAWFNGNLTEMAQDKLLAALPSDGVEGEAGCSHYFCGEHLLYGGWGSALCEECASKMDGASAGEETR